MGKMLKTIQFCVLKISTYDTVKFLTLAETVFNSSSLLSKTSQKATETALAECSMLITFLQEVICVVTISL